MRWTRVLRQAVVRAVCFPTVARKDSGPNHDSATSFAEVVTAEPASNVLLRILGVSWPGASLWHVYTDEYILNFEEWDMPYARVFQSGNSQAVRLPKEFRFQTDRVEIYRRGDELVMREAPINATAIFDALAGMPTDFMADGREDTPPQDRDSL